jgi:hypothetical protein
VSSGPSVGLLAVRAIYAAVTATGSPAPAERTDTTEYTAERLPAYNVFRKKDSPRYEGAQDSACLSFEVIIRAMVKATAQADEAVDPLVVWAWQQVMADPTLGSLVQDAKITDVEYNYVPKGDYDQLAADLTVEVTVDVSRSDPTQNKTYPS